MSRVTQLAVAERKFQLSLFVYQDFAFYAVQCRDSLLTNTFIKHYTS